MKQILMEPAEQLGLLAQCMRRMRTGVNLVLPVPSPFAVPSFFDSTLKLKYKKLVPTIMTDILVYSRDGMTTYKILQ